jgi:hypothetical protein
MTQNDTIKKEQERTTTAKKNFLEALKKSLGVITPACNLANIGRKTYYRWIETDLEFYKEVKDIENVSLDFAESKLHELINDGNCSATIFFLKTKGKERGYIERVENVNSQKDPFAEMSDDEIKNRLNELRSKRDN